MTQLAALGSSLDLSLRLYCTNEKSLPTLAGCWVAHHLTSRVGRPAYTLTDSEGYTSAYTKVYESVCPVGVGVHCGTMGPGLRQPRRWNPGLEPKLLGHLT